MQPLTPQAQQRVAELASRYSVTGDAVMTMLQAVANGNGSMAQFYCAELGGGGQWMQGGMTMIGDMFNDGLKAKVNGLCSELSDLLNTNPFQPRPSGIYHAPHVGQHQSQSQGTGSSFSLPAGGNSGSWWPAELGFPSATGSQNDLRYAYFSGAHRLAVEAGGRVCVYDTLDHLIGGFAQQQGGGTSITFTSQYGTVNLASLPMVSGGSGQPPSVAPAGQPSSPQPYQPTSNQASAQETDIFAKIERLAELRQKGVLTDEEFAAKKAELLSRL